MEEAQIYYAAHWLFIGLACIIGIIYAALVGCDVIGAHTQRWNAEARIEDDDTEGNCSDDFDVDNQTIGGKSGENSHSWNRRSFRVAVLLLLGSGVSLLTAGIFVRIDGVQNENDSRTANGTALIIFGMASTLFSYPFLLYWQRGNVRMQILIAATYFLVIPGWILMSVTFKQMSTSAEYESTTMIITNSRAQFANNIGCKYGGVTCTGYRGVLEVSWAPARHCPDAPPDLWCNQWITVPSCDVYTHDGYDNFINDEVSARGDVADCLTKRFNLLAFGEESVLSPEQRDNSRSTMIEAYGSCSSPCNATLNVSEDLLEVTKPLGLIMSIVGVCIVILASTLCRGLRQETPPPTATLKTNTKSRRTGSSSDSRVKQPPIYEEGPSSEDDDDPSLEDETSSREEKEVDEEQGLFGSQQRFNVVCDVHDDAKPIDPGENSMPCDEEDENCYLSVEADHQETVQVDATELLAGKSCSQKEDEEQETDTSELPSRRVEKSPDQDVSKICRPENAQELQDDSTLQMNGLQEEDGKSLASLKDNKRHHVARESLSEEGNSFSLYLEELADRLRDEMEGSLLLNDDHLDKVEDDECLPSQDNLSLTSKEANIPLADSEEAYFPNDREANDEIRRQDTNDEDILARVSTYPEQGENYILISEGEEGSLLSKDGEEDDCESARRIQLEARAEKPPLSRQDDAIASSTSATEERKEIHEPLDTDIEYKNYTQVNESSSRPSEGEKLVSMSTDDSLLKENQAMNFKQVESSPLNTTKSVDDDSFPSNEKKLG